MNVAARSRTEGETCSKQPQQTFATYFPSPVSGLMYVEVL